MWVCRAPRAGRPHSPPIRSASTAAAPPPGPFKDDLARIGTAPGAPPASSGARSRQPGLAVPVRRRRRPRGPARAPRPAPRRRPGLPRRPRRGGAPGQGAAAAAPAGAPVAPGRPPQRHRGAPCVRGCACVLTEARAQFELQLTPARLQLRGHSASPRSLTLRVWLLLALLSHSLPALTPNTVFSVEEHTLSALSAWLTAPVTDSPRRDRSPLCGL